MKQVKFKEIPRGCYIALNSYKYYSKRYNKFVTVPKGYVSDGATGAIDVDSDAWWVHDVLCPPGTFDDGATCTNWQASTILSDILKVDQYPLRTVYWKWLTYWFGGNKLYTWWRDNDKETHK